MPEKRGGEKRKGGRKKERNMLVKLERTPVEKC